MKKILLTLGITLSCLFGFSQERPTTELAYTNKVTNEVTKIEVDKEIADLVYIFLNAGTDYGFDYSERIKDVKGIYVGPLADDIAGVTYYKYGEKDYVVINEDLKYRELIFIVVFHELYHLWDNDPLNDDHCYSDECSAIMAPSIDGNIKKVLCNLEVELDKLFTALVESQKNRTDGQSEQKAKDYIIECKKFSTRE